MNHFSQILAVFSLTSFLIAQITVDSTVFKGVVSTQNYDGIDENNLVLIDALFYETFYENETNKPYSGKAFRTYQGGKIKFKNLAIRNTARKTATNKLLSKGLDFTVNVIGTAPQSSALGMKANIISLLKKSGRTVINYSA